MSVLFESVRGRTSKLRVAGVLLALWALGTACVGWAAPNAHAGFAQGSLDIAGQAQGTEMAAWYPTQTPERALRQGPYTLSAAPNAAPLPGRHPMVIVSHGTGGFQLNHHELAAHLARSGFVVVALTHNGDNFADSSLLGKPEYLTERPKQVSRLLDALLADPTWSARIDPQRIGFFGHSAGGFVGLALAGAVPSVAQTTQHCVANYDDDAWFCARGGSKAEMSSRMRAIQTGTPSQALPPLADSRIRAFAVAAPVGAFFSANGLSPVRAPMLVIAPGQDRVLVPRFHSGYLLRHLAAAERLAFDEAGHFMAMSKLGMPAMAHGEDVNADPPGTDRATAIAHMGELLPQWFNKALSSVRITPN